MPKTSSLLDGLLAIFGNDTDFQDGVTALGLRYAVAVGETTTVWPKGQGPLPPPRLQGWTSTRLRRDAQHQPVTVKQLALSLGQKKFRTVSWREGAQGLMQSEFAAVRVRSAHRDYTRTQPRAEEWLLIEWPAGQAEPTQYWRLTLRKKTSLKKLVYLDSFRSGPIIKDEFTTKRPSYFWTKPKMGSCIGIGQPF